MMADIERVGAGKLRDIANLPDQTSLADARNSERRMNKAPFVYAKFRWKVRGRLKRFAKWHMRKIISEGSRIIIQSACEIVLREHVRILIVSAAAERLQSIGNEPKE